MKEYRALYNPLDQRWAIIEVTHLETSAGYLQLTQTLITGLHREEAEEFSYLLSTSQLAPVEG